MAGAFLEQTADRGVGDLPPENRSVDEARSAEPGGVEAATKRQKLEEIEVELRQVEMFHTLAEASVLVEQCCWYRCIVEHTFTGLNRHRLPSLRQERRDKFHSAYCGTRLHPRLPPAN